ncbi:beta-lactamase [Hyaloscypha finlandica]|nr:beta-lactamase [Hyaloscypha finlandica]
MKMFANWVHGHALTVESLDCVSRYQHVRGGTEVTVKPGKSSWLHIALPTRVIIDDVRSQLQRIFILFDAQNGGRITEVEIYDGPIKVQDFKQLSLKGTHASPDSANTFNLPTLHSVRWGIGISFLFTADTDYEEPIRPSDLVVSTAGGDFTA